MRRVAYAKDNDVGFDRVRVDLYPVEVRQPGGQHRCVCVILCEPIDVVVERVEAAGCNKPGLAHRPTPHLLVSPRFLDQFGGASEHCSDRTAEPLREVDPGCVEAGREGGGLDS